MEDTTKQNDYLRGKFEGAVLQSLDDLKKQLKDYDEKHVEASLSREKLEKRIRGLESWKSYMLGAIAVAGIVGGFVGVLIQKYI